MTSLLDVKNLSVAYQGKAVLSGVSLSIAPGEIVTVVGPNGSGKSTLMRAILGSVAPTTGTITKRDGLRIGYIPQKLHIDQTLPLTVSRFLNLPHPVSRAERNLALDRAGAADLGPRQMGDLSGGQFQRVLLARALLGSPEFLILDEATRGLDQSGSAAFYEEVESVCRDTGAAVLMVSHELHVVMAASDRVLCLNGHICCEGAPEHVASAPEYRALFGTGTRGTLALYRHEHDHAHHHDHHHDHDHPHHEHH